MVQNTFSNCETSIKYSEIIEDVIHLYIYIYLHLYLYSFND